MASQQHSKRRREAKSNIEWPTSGRKTQGWRQTTRDGIRDDRMLSEIAVSIPPFIAERLVSMDSAHPTNISPDSPSEEQGGLAIFRRLQAMGRQSSTARR